MDPLASNGRGGEDCPPSTPSDRPMIVPLNAPDLRLLGPHALAPFEAKRLTSPTVVWMNIRWFREQGVDLRHEIVRERMTAWVLTDFAFAIPLSSDKPTDFHSETRTFFADRYGGGNGTARHGGSGRVATAGAFQVKGIGVTPLVGDITEWGYSHGCLWLEEAIREAILAEIAFAEFPKGAIEAIAIIDTGLNYPEIDGRMGERRSLLIRNSVLRPAHFERASGFVGGGDRTEQLVDVKRTREAIVAFEREAGLNAGLKIRVHSISEILTNVSAQIAFGQVHRLFHGGYFSSNLAINGELTDFGSFRALPDWARSFVNSHSLGFGCESQIMLQLANSLTFHFNKYQSADHPPLSKAALYSEYLKAFDHSFDLEVLRLWALPDDGHASNALIISAVRTYFKQQQKILRNYEMRIEQTSDWLYRYITNIVPDVHPFSIESKTINIVDNALRERFGNGPPGRKQRLASWSSALRFLEPRVGIFRESLQAALFSLIGQCLRAGTMDAESLNSFFELTMTTNRRHWPLLPTGLTVVAQVHTSTGRAVACERVADEKMMLWLEGAATGDSVYLFEHSVPLTSLSHMECRRDNGSVGILVPLQDDTNFSQPFGVDVAGRELAIPPLLHRYRAVENPLLLA